MSQLAQALHEEHRMIVMLLKELRSKGISDEIGRERLMEAKQIILEHLENEDLYLYPTLRAHEETSELALKYAEEMDDLSLKFLDFFERFEQAEDASEFSAEMGRILGALQARITREDFALLPAYQKVREKEKAVQATAPQRRAS